MATLSVASGHRTSRQASHNQAGDAQGADGEGDVTTVRQCQHAGGSVGVLPRTRRRSIHDSRNLSRAPSASLVIGYAAP
jgi:hypothetical protein